VFIYWLLKCCRLFFIVRLTHIYMADMN
jgi:hypothetical protein